MLFSVPPSEAAYSYSGTVKNGGGQGIAGATVTFSGSGVSAQTTSTGTFV